MLYPGAFTTLPIPIRRGLASTVERFLLKFHPAEELLLLLSFRLYFRQYHPLIFIGLTGTYQCYNLNYLIIRL